MYQVREAELLVDRQRLHLKLQRNRQLSVGAVEASEAVVDRAELIRIHVVAFEQRRRLGQALGRLVEVADVEVFVAPRVQQRRFDAVIAGCARVVEDDREPWTVRIGAVAAQVVEFRERLAAGVVRRVERRDRAAVPDMGLVGFVTGVRVGAATNACRAEIVHVPDALEDRDRLFELWVRVVEPQLRRLHRTQGVQAAAFPEVVVELPRPLDHRGVGGRARGIVAAVPRLFRRAVRLIQLGIIRRRPFQRVRGRVLTDGRRCRGRQADRAHGHGQDPCREEAQPAGAHGNQRDSLATASQARAA